MKNFATRSLTAAAFVLFASAAAMGQSVPPGPPSPEAGGRPGGIGPRADTDARTYREAKLRSAEIGTSAGGMTPQQLAAAIEQTRNDFKRIQLVRNDLVDLLVSKKPFDYGQLAEQAEEINKRAHRLKSFLMKPAPQKSAEEEKADDAARPVYDEAAMRGALVKLCNTIHSFTGNPMFKNPEVVDARQPAKAGGELLDIIELSENVKLNAERMAKAK
ncbi:MAG: hypothetical protein LC795_02775 [Acidobacteria bacterium]|nr:hypothetical protein [Acidobacteriota bacterium]